MSKIVWILVLGSLALLIIGLALGDAGEIGFNGRML